MPGTPIECILNLSGQLQNNLSGFGLAGLVAEEKTGSGPLVVWIILFVIVILNSAWLFFLTKKGLYYRDRIRRHDKEISNVSSQAVKNAATDTRDIRKIKEDIINLGSDLELLNSRIDELSEPAAGNKELNGLASPSEIQTAGSVFYLGTPPAEKILKKQLFTRTFIPGVTLFRFVYNDERSAGFRFAGDERSTRDALSSPYKFIEPICNIENPDAPGARKITTTTDGSVERSGEDWIIKLKATVRYE